MEFRDPGGREELFARQTERMRAELLDSGMPIFTLTPSTRPAPECFGGLETTAGTITAVRLIYPPATPGGSWVSVETTRLGGAAPLRTTLEHHISLGGDRLTTFTWAETAATLRVDGHTLVARRLNAGDRWWVLRGELSGLEITVVSRDWHPATVAVETLADLVPMLDRLRTEPPPRPTELAGEPHRALADAVLEHAAVHAAWLAGGAQVPRLPDHWAALWQAAVRRQSHLSDQPEPEAAAAVSSITSHLTSLFHNAEWFRTDAELQRRAVAEVLLYGTGLGTEVPSRRAQEAWQRHGGRTGTGNREWHAAWEEWAGRGPA